uniref:Uncharacterized protein n=1 Tax=Ascaris lumbricoides TaxID=6252 RepID=A0A9J2PY66_ASCLU
MTYGGGGGGSIDDPFEEVLGLIDEFDSADLSDITQRTAGVEWPRSLRDYKEICKMMRKCSRKMSSDLREKDVAIHESQAEESRFKEENTSLKRKINRTHSEMEAVSGELKDLNRIDRELNEAIETRKMPLEELENNYYMLLFSTAFARKKSDLLPGVASLLPVYYLPHSFLFRRRFVRMCNDCRLSDLLDLRRKKVVVAMDSRSNTIKAFLFEFYVPFDARKVLTARSWNELTNENGNLSNSMRSQGNYEEWLVISYSKKALSYYPVPNMYP